MIESSVQDLAAAFDAVVDGLLETDYEAVPAAELAALLAAREVQRRRLEADDARLIAALAAQASPAAFGATSVPDLVGGLTRVSRAEARARVQRAEDVTARRALSGEALPPIHPRTAQALAEGVISGAHVDVITRYLGRLPAEVANQVVVGPAGPQTLFDVAEDFLVTAAGHEDPATLRRSGDLLLARLDPDGAEPRDEEQQRRRSFGIGGRRPNGVHGDLTDEAKAVWQPILDALGAPRPAEDGTRDERSAGQRWHDALLEAGLRLLRSGTLPDCGGTPVSVVVRVGAEDLAKVARGEGGVAQSAHGDLVDAQRFLRLAGEAEITAVVLTAHGEILDYGRTRRLACPAQRKALTARDGGCCFPGCTRPAAWCEAHHIRAWINGGQTTLDNLCLLCASSSSYFRGRRMVRGDDRRRPPMDSARVAGPEPKTQTQHRPPPARDSLRRRIAGEEGRGGGRSSETRVAGTYRTSARPMTSFMISVVPP